MRDLLVGFLGDLMGGANVQQSVWSYLTILATVRSPNAHLSAEVHSSELAPQSQTASKHDVLRLRQTSRGWLDA